MDGDSAGTGIARRTVWTADSFRPGQQTSTRGNAVGDGHTTVETYQRVDDEAGPALQFSMVVTDPEYLTQPWEMSWIKYYAAADYVRTPNDCRVPFEAVD